MQSGSHSSRSLGRQTNRLAEFLGILIALLTLTLPLFVIAYYSSNRVASQPITEQVRE